MNLNTSLSPYQGSHLNLTKLSPSYDNVMMERTSIEIKGNSNTNEQPLTTTTKETKTSSKNVLTAATALANLGSDSKETHEAQKTDQENETASMTKDSSKEENKFASHYSGGDDVPLTFPQRLMEMLSNEDHSDIVAWLPHGLGFMIYQKKRFAEQILPVYFKKTKFTSFTRKLNRWSFNRITRGPESGAYYHPFFQRGNMRLCLQMCCQNTKMAKAQEARQYNIFGPNHTIIPSSTTISSVTNTNHNSIMDNAMSSLNIHTQPQEQQQQQQQHSLAASDSMQTSASPDIGVLQFGDTVRSNGEDDLGSQLLKIQLEHQRQQILQLQQLLQQPIGAQPCEQMQQETPPQGQQEFLLISQEQHPTQDEMKLFEDHHFQPTPLPPVPLRPSNNHVGAPQHQQQEQHEDVRREPLQYHNDFSTSAQPSFLPTETLSSGVQAITPTSTPASEGPDLNSIYSQSVVHAAIHALERSNQTAFLSAKMAHDKVIASNAESVGNGVSSPSMIPTDNTINLVELQKKQVELVLDQQRQLDEYAKQRMFQAAAESASKQPHQQDISMNVDGSPHLVTSSAPLPQYETGMERRAKAA